MERTGGTVLVKELLTDEPQLAVQSLLAALEAGQAVVRAPVSFGIIAGGCRPFGVMKWLDDGARDWWDAGSAGWLAFAFD